MFKKILLAFVILSAALAGYLWMNKTEIVTGFNEERTEQRAANQKAGRLFGEAHNQTQCLEKTLADFDGCQQFGCSVNSGLFLKNCLATATPDADFCVGVPEFREEPTEDDKSWAKFACIDKNVRGEACRLLMRQVSQFCSE